MKFCCTNISPLNWVLVKLIEGLKSPDTSSLMLPDLLSLSDPFGGSVEESAKGLSYGLPLVINPL